MDTFIALLIILFNLYILRKNAVLKYDLHFLSKFLSCCIKVVAILCLITYVEVTTDFNRKSLCNGYSFKYVNSPYGIEYSSKNIKGFTSEDKYGGIFIKEHSVIQEYVSVCAVEYSDNYIIARGVDRESQILYWIIYPEKSDIIGPLILDDFMMECKHYGIQSVYLTLLENNQLFAF